MSAPSVHERLGADSVFLATPRPLALLVFAAPVFLMMWLRLKLGVVLSAVVATATMAGMYLVAVCLRVLLLRSAVGAGIFDQVPLASSFIVTLLLLIGFVGLLGVRPWALVYAVASLGAGIWLVVVLFAMLTKLR